MKGHSNNKQKGVGTIMVTLGVSSRGGVVQYYDFAYTERELLRNT